MRETTPEYRELVLIHSTIGHTTSNAPWLSFGIWFQGCNIGCEGCWNPGTHGHNIPLVDGGPYFTTVKDLLDAAPVDVEGISVSGGEPTQQPHALVELLRLAKSRGLHTLVFSGRDLEDILIDTEAVKALPFIDILVAGPYVRALRTDNETLLGSTNQRIHFLSGKFTSKDLEKVKPWELSFDQDDGTVKSTGSATRIK